MKHVVPRCYKDFVCTADQCKKNCCSDGWDIEVEQDTLDLYEKQGADVSGPLFSSLREEDGYYYFKTCKGSCTWLDEKGLCGIYGKFGSQFQSSICRLFPRFSEYFGDYKESGIGLGCEESARLIFSEDAPFDLVSEEIDEEVYEDDEYDANIASVIMKLREELMDLSLREDLSISVKLVEIIDRCSEVQEELNKGAFDYDKSKSHKEKEADKGNVVFSEFDMWKGLDSIYGSLVSFPDKRPDLEKILKKMKSFIKEERKDVYQICEARISLSKRDRDYGRFLAYLLYRYLAKSVYDRNIDAKAKLIASLFIILKTWDAIFFLNNEKMSLDDRIDIVETMSREIEYSEDSMECLYEDFIFEDIYKKENLKALILSIEGKFNK